MIIKYTYVGSIINMNDKNQRTLNSQNNEDVCGKIILIDLINSNFEIYAKGLRNVIGLYSENNITLATDNGHLEVMKLTK